MSPRLTCTARVMEPELALYQNNHNRRGSRRQVALDQKIVLIGPQIIVQSIDWTTNYCTNYCMNWTTNF